MGILEWFFYSKSTNEQIEKEYQLRNAKNKLTNQKPNGGITYTINAKDKAYTTHHTEATKIITKHDNFMYYIPTCKFGYNYMIFAQGNSIDDLEDLIVSFKTKIFGNEIHTWTNTSHNGFHLYAVFEDEEDYTLINLIHANESVKIERIFKNE